MDERQAQVMKSFPDMREFVNMEPEEIGPLILRHIAKEGSMLNRFNFFRAVPNQVAHHMMEAWSWLEREGFIAVKPNDQYGLDFFITRKGQTIVAEENFGAYLQAAIFPTDLDPMLIRTVKPLFRRGDYDTAVWPAPGSIDTRLG